VSKDLIIFKIMKGTKTKPAQGTTKTTTKTGATASSSGQRATGTASKYLTLI